MRRVAARPQSFLLASWGRLLKALRAARAQVGQLVLAEIHLQPVRVVAKKALEDEN